MFVDTVLDDLKQALSRGEISKEKFIEEYDKYLQSKEFIKKEEMRELCLK